MVDRAESGLKGKDVKYYYWKVYEVEVSQNDTVTLDEFSTTENLKVAVINQNGTGAVVTCTYAANNVVTVTGAGTNMACTLYAFGRKA